MANVVKNVTRVIVRQAGPKGKGLFATEPFQRGEVLCTSDGELKKTPTKYTVQFDDKTHIDVQPPLVFANHHCEPNARITFEGKTVVLEALKAIKPQDEIFFDYNTTEVNMDSPFKCECGAPNCHGHIKGFAHLPSAKWNSMRDKLSPYVKSVLDQMVNQPDTSKEEAA